jgi:hypothetical protein
MGWSPTAAILRLFSSDRTPSSRARPHDDALRETQRLLAPILAELDELRRRTLLEIDILGAALVPFCAAAGALFGWFNPKGSPFHAVLYGGLGALIGGGIAYSGPDRRFRSAYKSVIIPHLLARFGDLTYQPAEKVDLRRLCKAGLLPAYGPSTIEDEVLGRYRGIPIRMVEAKLETGGKNSQVVFNGLVAAMHFPGRFQATTVVTKDPGSLFGMAADVFGTTGLERIRLEDPRFEARYQVYGSDQVAARALLTPAVMQRMLELDTQAPNEPARLMAEPETLWVAIPTRVSGNLFEPPGLHRPVSTAIDHLGEITREIAAVLRVLDAMLELDPHAAPPPRATTA